MNRFVKIVSLFFLASLVYGCRKEEPVNFTGTPVFYVNGTLNGSPLSLRAGENNYYMYSSYASDINDVYEFTGDMRTQGSNTNSPSSFKVTIRDYNQHNIVNTSIDSALQAGAYTFVSPSVGTTINFTAQPQGDSVMSYSWSFGDNATSSLANPAHTYATAGVYNVCLMINYFHNNQACSSSICDTVTVGTTPCMYVTFSSQDVDVDSSFTGDSLQFNATIAGGTAPYVYAWNFGDSFSGTGNPVIHSYAQPNLFTVQLTATDNNGCIIRKTRNAATPGWPTCVTNFDWQPVLTGGLDLSKVVISWTDASGTVFRSDGGTQPVSSSFQLVSVEEYEPNETQQRTKKVTMLVTCTLFNGTNTQLLQNAEIVFSVAYP